MSYLASSHLRVTISCHAQPTPETESGPMIISCPPTTAGFPWLLLGVAGMKEEFCFRAVKTLTLLGAFSSPNIPWLTAAYPLDLSSVCHFRI